MLGEICFGRRIKNVGRTQIRKSHKGRGPRPLPAAPSPFPSGRGYCSHLPMGVAACREGLANDEALNVFLSGQVGF